MNSLEKTISCVRALELATLEDVTIPELKSYIKANLGKGWSLVAAAQFLTGRSAIDSFNELPNNFQSDGLEKAKIGAFMAVAHFFCANASQDGPISNGVLVSKFVEGNDMSEVERIRSLLSSKIGLN